MIWPMIVFVLGLALSTIFVLAWGANFSLASSGWDTLLVLAVASAGISLVALGVAVYRAIRSLKE